MWLERLLLTIKDLTFKYLERYCRYKIFFQIITKYVLLCKIYKKGPMTFFAKIDIYGKDKQQIICNLFWQKKNERASHAVCKLQKAQIYYIQSCIWTEHTRFSHSPSTEKDYKSSIAYFSRQNQFQQKISSDLFRRFWGEKHILFEKIVVSSIANEIFKS